MPLQASNIVVGHIANSKNPFVVVAYFMSAAVAGTIATSIISLKNVVALFGPFEAEGIGTSSNFPANETIVAACLSSNPLSIRFVSPKTHQFWSRLLRLLLI